MSERKSYHHHDLRGALLDAVLAALDAGDAERLSMRELAARVGVSHTAAYAHFADKRALLTEAAAGGFEELRATTARAAARAPGPSERLVATGLAYLGFARKRRGLYRLMFGGSSEIDERHARLKEFAGASYAVVRGAVASVPYDGAPRPGARIEEDTAAAWALVHGIAALEASAALDAIFPSSSAMRRFERTALATFVRGLERGAA